MRSLSTKPLMAKSDLNYEVTGEDGFRFVLVRVMRVDRTHPGKRAIHESHETYERRNVRLLVLRG